MSITQWIFELCVSNSDIIFPYLYAKGCSLEIYLKLPNTKSNTKSAVLQVIVHPPPKKKNIYEEVNGGEGKSIGLSLCSLVNCDFTAWGQRLAHTHGLMQSAWRPVQQGAEVIGKLRWRSLMCVICGLDTVWMKHGGRRKWGSEVKAAEI